MFPFACREGSKPVDDEEVCHERRVGRIVGRITDQVSEEVTISRVLVWGLVPIPGCVGVDVVLVGNDMRHQHHEDCGQSRSYCRGKRCNCKPSITVFAQLIDDGSEYPSTLGHIHFSGICGELLAKRTCLSVL